VQQHVPRPQPLGAALYDHEFVAPSREAGVQRAVERQTREHAAAPVLLHADDAIVCDVDEGERPALQRHQPGNPVCVPACRQDGPHPTVAEAPGGKAVGDDHTAVVERDHANVATWRRTPSSPTRHARAGTPSVDCSISSTLPSGRPQPNRTVASRTAPRSA
jgi:hypothetical protein